MEHEYRVKNSVLFRDGEPIAFYDDSVKLDKLAQKLNQRNKELADASRLMRERKSVCG